MNARILIIDDSDHLRTILKVTLQFKGYLVSEADNGKNGLQTALAEPFDLVLCDIDMPVMNGLEFVRRYRAEVSTATPVVMLTAEGDDLIKAALAVGATSCIHKPFEPMVLLDQIEKSLSRKAD